MPWGDPDLQGNYTNKYEQSTPFERPYDRVLDEIQWSDTGEDNRKRDGEGQQPGYSEARCFRLTLIAPPLPAEELRDSVRAGKARLYRRTRKGEEHSGEREKKTYLTERHCCL